MKKGLETYLYSTLGVVAMLVLLVAFNLISSRLKQRVDLTTDRAYTLSPGTRAILAKIDTPIQIRFYCTRGDNAMPVEFKTYSQRVEDLIGEFTQVAKSQIEIQKLDPQPDSDAEDSAKLDGIEGQLLPQGTPLYLGLSVSCLDQKEAIPFLDPSREQTLEYDLVRAISRVISAKKPVIGVMSPLPVVGSPMSPMLMRMGQQGQRPWVFLSELQRDFSVKTVEMNAEEIPADISVLLVIHPKGISDTTQYALDQFVLRGGKLIACLDPFAALDQQQGPMGAAMPSSSSLDKLLNAWGLSFDTSKVVADTDNMGGSPAVLMLTEKAFNQDDVLTSQIDNVVLGFAGAFTGSPAQGLQQSILIASSKNAQLIDTTLAQRPGDEILKNFKASGTPYSLAVRLTGKFKTAFPAGKPKAPTTQPSEPKSEEAKPAEAPSLKESAQDGAVVLIGDSDLIQDQVAVREIPNPMTRQRMIIPQNANLTLAQNAVEQLSGDSNLIAVRSRASRARPFTVIGEMQTAAENRFRATIKDLETSLAEAQRKLQELHQSKGQQAGQRYILSPEQQQEIANFRKKETEMKQQLKAERKKLRADIESLETRLKVFNIAGMPLFVALGGLILAVARRKRQAAH